MQKLSKGQHHRYYQHHSLECDKGLLHWLRRINSKNRSQRVQGLLVIAKHLSPSSSVHQHHLVPLFISRQRVHLFLYMSCCLNVLYACAHHAFLKRFVKLQFIYYYFWPWEREAHLHCPPYQVFDLERFVHS